MTRTTSWPSGGTSKSSSSALARTRGHVNAGKQAERLADCNALRALADQITRSRWEKPARNTHCAARVRPPGSARRRPPGSGGAGGGPAGQRGGLLVRARRPQAVQQAGHGGRVVEGGVGGWVTGQQRGGLLVRARLPQAVQQAGHGGRVVEGGVGGGAGPASAAACSCAPASRRLSSRRATAAGSSRGAWAAARAGQRGGLLVRARRPQAVQQAGHGGRVVEGGVGGGPGWPARRPARARPPPAGGPAGRPRRPGRRGGRGRRVAGQQRGGLLVRARLPQAVQQPGHGGRVVEGGVGGGSGPASAAACSCAPASRRLSSRPATAAGSSRGAWAAARLASAAACSCAPASRRLSSRLATR